MKDQVIIIDGGKEIKMSRNEAIKKYTNYADMCEGAEREGYMSIVAGCRAGCKKVDDFWDWQMSL